MMRLRTPISNLVAGWVVAVHLILLPALYFGLGHIVRTSHADLFIEHARTFARIIADEFEVGAALETPARIADLLDLAMIHGDGSYAELIYQGHSYRSEIGSRDITAPKEPDLGFDHGGDVTYFIVLPIVHRGMNAELRLGFDERPTQQRIKLAMDRMFWLLATYLSIAISIAFILSYRLSRPIQRLKQVSRSIASGRYSQALQVNTAIQELHELASDLDHMRRELVGVNEKLQAQIKERESAESQREQLQQQLRHRQRLETVGTLAGGIAHEFNNLLVPIILFTDTALQELPAGSASKPDLERVLTSARRAKDVVKKILMFSRELGNVNLNPTDLRGVIAEAITLFAALAPPSIEIRTEIGDHVPLVKADATLAVQLTMNLCTNAYQAMRDTGGILTIRLEAAATGGVDLIVSDTGHGMDVQTVERIFEPFFTTRSVGEGTGLGLSVVHGIVESFGASITVDTKPGAGSTFTIYFPTA